MLPEELVSLFVAGLVMAASVVALVVGGGWVVRSGSALARRMGVSEFAVAATIVAVGTSLPELVVSVLAAAGGHPDIAVGNVFGSNIANVGLVLGLSAVLSPPVKMVSPQTRITLWLYLALVGALGLSLWIVPELNWVHGVFLLLGMGSLVWWLYRKSTGDPSGTEVVDGEGNPSFAHRFWVRLLSRERFDALSARVSPESSLAGAIVVLSLGLGLLVVGGKGFVDGAVVMAKAFGLPELVIGLVMVAVGTSLPEVAVSTVAAARGRGDMSIGNVVGSNLFNLLLVLGVSSLVYPIHIDLRDRTSLMTYVAMFVMGLLMAFPFLFGKRRYMGRRYGAFLLLLYGGVVVFWFV